MKYLSTEQQKMEYYFLTVFFTDTPSLFFLLTNQHRCDVYSVTYVMYYTVVHFMSMSPSPLLPLPLFCINIFYNHYVTLLLSITQLTQVTEKYCLFTISFFIHKSLSRLHLHKELVKMFIMYKWWHVCLNIFKSSFQTKRDVHQFVLLWKTFLSAGI